MARDYDAEIERRIAEEMEKAPPLTERQKELIRATFEELRRRQAADRETR